MFLVPYHFHGFLRGKCLIFNFSFSMHNNLHSIFFQFLLILMKMWLNLRENLANKMPFNKGNRFYRICLTHTLPWAGIESEGCMS